MKGVLLALTVAFLLLVAGVGTAAASTPGGQVVGEAAASDQEAGAAAGIAQQEPTNESSPVRVLSPGDGGSVSQTNEATSDATAGNANVTGQTAAQGQAGGSGQQVVGQSSTNAQAAFALAFTLQHGASNENQPVRVLSPGDDGDVSQSNEASSDAAAGNKDATGQTAEQAQAGSSCCGGGGDQIVGQSASNEQEAAALAATKQEKPSNSNVSVRVLSPGDDGDVSQSNEATSSAEAGNLNVTKQAADQTQSGDSCKCGGGGEQVIGQSASNDQDAAALAATKQEKPSNSNISVRVLSPGDGGSVEQSNVASSNAKAGNLNLTGQSADQTQGGGRCCGGGGEQVIGQSADSEQDAKALSATKQEKPSNSNISVRVLSPGDDGKVTQTNEASSNVTAGNLNATKQTADQTQGGGSGLQAIGQSATSEQGAFALGLTVQKGASNENKPVRVLSPGDSGDVTQSNVASSDATAGNLNATKQQASQTQPPDCACLGGLNTCGCFGGGGFQVIGQSADSKQEAGAISATIQSRPSNSNSPVRVASPGDDGSVSQSNLATSDATAGNLNLTKQAADQIQGGGGIQAIGQSATNAQRAFALGLTIQKGASNENTPIRVHSPGNGGSVSQSNVATSSAAAGNLNGTLQAARQVQGDPGSRTGHCCGEGIQAIGQSSRNHQDADALAATVQLSHEPLCRCIKDSHGGNSNEPTRVSSRGDDGAVRQLNLASSDAKAKNANVTKQAAIQVQPLRCGCWNDHVIQAIGQVDDSHQLAGAVAASLDAGLLNRSHPERKKSPGANAPVNQNDMTGAQDRSGSSSESSQFRNQIER